MSDFKHQDISRKFHDHGIFCTHVSFELKQCIIRKSEPNFNVNKALFQLFDPLLEKTFNEKVVIDYCEYVTTEIVLLLHNFFSNTACNIQNICLLQSAVGTEDFYDDYCKLMNVVGMEIFYVPSGLWDNYFTVCPEKHFYIDKKISYLFNFYGGTYEVDPPERTFLSLFASQFADRASIEFLGKCGTKEKLTNWLEYKTFFVSQKFVEKYQSLYDLHVQSNRKLNKKLIKHSVTDVKPVQYEVWAPNVYQEQCDRRVLFNLLRETTSFEPMAYTSEKIFRCFINHIIPIPVTGSKLIEHFQDIGFWIDTNFIDYSYLKCKKFEDRINGLESSLRNLEKIPNNTLQKYYDANKKKFVENQKLAFNIRNHTEIQINKICKHIKQYNETHVS